MSNLIPIMSGSFGDVQLRSYIVHLMQLALLSLISEDNNCVSILVCSYPISSPYSQYLWLKEWHCHSVALTAAVHMRRMGTKPQTRHRAAIQLDARLGIVGRHGSWGPTLMSFYLFHLQIHASFIAP